MDTPYVIEHRKRVESTQDVARALAESNSVNVLVTADEQVGGRGRSGNTWQQADANLFMSIALRPVWPIETWGRIPLVVGTAAASAIDSVCGVSVGLKWPNDLVVDEKKVGGILVEAGDGLVVVGCGLNLTWNNPPAGAAGIVAAASECDRDSLATAIADNVIRILDRDADAWPLADYKARCVTLGKQVTWHDGGPAKATDVLISGELVVRTSGGDIPLVASEVRHVRPASLSDNDNER
jgi:BirA family transcriptional regulator, biotin operon repressor / biotin---[acetyl-CoA-carboxylase] ligase